MMQVEWQKALTRRRRLWKRRSGLRLQGENRVSCCTATNVALHRAQPILRPTTPTLGSSWRRK
jgi:hypothetical protein